MSPNSYLKTSANQKLAFGRKYSQVETKKKRRKKGKREGDNRQGKRKEQGGK